MSVIPFIFNNTPNFLDQYFGRDLDLDDFFDASMVPFVPRKIFGPWKSELAEMEKEFGIKSDKDKYQVCVDVQQFTPQEITVKTIGREILIEGKHEEENDERGYISRNFVRKFVLPEGLKMEDVTSTLSSDGVLSISVPKTVPAITENQRDVPIAKN